MTQWTTSVAVRGITATYIRTHIPALYNAHKTLHLICTTRIITLPNWIAQHHLSTQALSSFIYYCYFCCIDIQYCACIFKLVCYATVYC